MIEDEKNEMLEDEQEDEQVENKAQNESNDEAFEDEHQGKKKVLVVDDLGVVTFQLQVIFNKNNYSVAVSQEIYDAIKKYKRNNFDLAIIDLFIPTEREGFLLLDELNKLNKTMNKHTKIGIITASNKKDLKIKCKQKGACFFMEKSSNWQTELLATCKKLGI